MAAASDSLEIKYMDTRAAYDAWSQVYDTDGNFLQALDTREMKNLLPRMLSLIDAPKPWKLVDLGCGTGRNTIALVVMPDVEEVVALDLSARMLDIAQTKLAETMHRSTSSPNVRFETFDMLDGGHVPVISRHADAVVSTLVVEHVPLDTFFRTAASILKPSGILLVTNMHAHMGGISQAGFVDPGSGHKIRPTSYAHTVADVQLQAEKNGFEIVGRVEERTVDDELAPELGPRATKWIGVTVWFGAIFRKLSS